MFVKIMLLSLFLVMLAVLAMAIRLLLKRKGEFSGGSCQSVSGLNEEGIACGCGAKKCP